MVEQYIAHLPDPAAARASIESLHPIGRTGKPADRQPGRLVGVGQIGIFHGPAIRSRWWLQRPRTTAGRSLVK